MKLSLPLAEDIKKLQSYLKDSAGKCLASLNENVDIKRWVLLTRLSLAQLILFNRRRSGETQRMTCSDFNTRNINTNVDILVGLSDFEKKLLEKYSKVAVIGKRGRPVTVLLTPDILEQMQKLMDTRHIVGIPDTNPYVFAQLSSDMPMRGSDCIRMFAVSAGLSNPSSITSTKLRKHIATMSQLMNLKKNELDMLASFLGHDILVHRNFYRLPQDTLEMTKVSKILMAMESGKVDVLKGKCLDEIEIDSGETFHIIIHHRSVASSKYDVSCLCILLATTIAIRRFHGPWRPSPF